MQKNKLGNSDIYITNVGFGAWAIGGGGWEFGWGPQNDNESVQAILKTLEMGINWRHYCIGSISFGSYNKSFNTSSISSLYLAIYGRIIYCALGN